MGSSNKHNVPFSVDLLGFQRREPLVPSEILVVNENGKELGVHTYTLWGWIRPDSRSQTLQLPGSVQRVPFSAVEAALRVEREVSKRVTAVHVHVLRKVKLATLSDCKDKILISFFAHWKQMSGLLKAETVCITHLYQSPWASNLFIFTLFLCIDLFCLFSCSVMFDSFATPWTIFCQAPLFMEFSRQDYWSGLPFPSWPRDWTRICIGR